jgi:hypothetical protein
MALSTTTARTARETSEHVGLRARLSAVANGLLERLGDGPSLISGDADSSLLAIGRDLQLEDLMYRRGARR